MRQYLFIILIIFPALAWAQNNSGQIHGDFDLNMQFYQDDKNINAVAPGETILNNSYLNIIYTKGNFTLGARYESYLNALLGLGHEQGYKGNGITHRFVTFTKDNLEVTAGSFYEQFGRGLVFRSYEDKNLGADNSLDGIRIKYEPLNGLYLKSFIGKSRTFFTKCK